MKKILALLCSLLLVPSLWAETKIIGYLPYWAQYSQFYPKDIRYEFVTHVHYGYLVPSGDQLAFADPTDEQNFKDLIQQATAAGVKVVGVVGGPGQAEAMKAAASGDLAGLAKNAAAYVHSTGLAGLELDWTFSDDADAQSFASMVKAFAAALDQVNPALSLSATLAVGKEKQPVFAENIVSLLDYITVSAIDEMSDAEASVKPNCSGVDVAAALADLAAKGIAKEKLVAVAPAYGKSFTGATGLGSSHKGVGSGNEGTLNYSELMAKFDGPGYKVSFDAATQSEVAVNDQETIVFNGIPSLKAIAENVKSNGYGGVALYDLSGDVKQPIISILVTVGKVLRPEVNYKGKKKK